jgi:hypothetical protein
MGKGKMLIKGYKICLTGEISFSDLLHNIVTIIHNNALCISKLLRVEFMVLTPKLTMR